MNRIEYVQTLAPALAAWRRTLIWTTAVIVLANAGLAIWMFHLVEMLDPNVEQKVLAIMIASIAITIGAATYASSVFARNSPACPKCGRHVRLLQRRHVWVSRKC